MRGWLAAVGPVLLLASACEPAPAPAQERPNEAEADWEAEPEASEPPPTPSKAPPVRADGTVFAETALMGTRFSVNVWVGPEGDADGAGQAIRDALAEVSRIESIASEWQPNSDVTRLNRAAGEFVEVAPELVEILQRARTISERTDGRFDVTFHGVGRLWSFEPGAKPPPRDAIERALASVDWRGVEIEGPRRVRLAHAEARIGLGAIAKGYGVDRASELLGARGFNNHIVEGGGDTIVRGSKGGEPWRVGVQHPGQRGAIGWITSDPEAAPLAVVTSGGYQRFFEHKGTRYAHIIDPATGWPVPADESAQSVTLVASDATTADALCTAVAVMGPKEGATWVEGQKDVEAVIIDAGGELWVSTGLADRFERTSPDR